jgi:hypothetical protein
MPGMDVVQRIAYRMGLDGIATYMAQGNVGECTQFILAGRI